MTFDTTFSSNDAGFPSTFSGENGSFEGGMTDGVVIHISDVYIRVDQTSEGVLITATDASGTTQAVVLNGKDGISPVIAVTAISGGHKVTVTDKNGQKSFDVLDGEPGEPGYTPKKGKDYWTDSDKSEIVDAVLEEMPEQGGGEPEVFWAIYDETTSDEILNAFNSEKMCYLQDGVYTAQIAYIRNGTAIFVGYNQNGSMLTYTCKSGVWSKVISSLQTAITGTAGDFVVIGEDGKVTTKTIPIYGGETE